MDWQMVIDKQGSALRQVLATLVAMAGLGTTSYLEDSSARQGEAELPAEPGEGRSPAELRGQFTFFPHISALHQDEVLAEKSKLSPALTLPRRLYRAILRLLRPAEAAARRLIIIAARDLTAALPPPCQRKPARRHRSIYVRPGRGTGIVVPWGVPMPDARPPSRLVSLRLFDPPLRLFVQRRHYASSAPRVLSFGGGPFPEPARPAIPPRSRIGETGLVDATRIRQRIEALARALGDLPKQALRFARWKARRAAGLARRAAPLRLGRAYALCRTGPRREVDEILADTHYFARLALNPDTS
jgi:hypothetical protein